MQVEEVSFSAAVSCEVPSRVSQTQFIRVASLANPLRLRSGEYLTEVDLAYETYGELNEDHSNAVLVFHALSGSQHAACYNTEVPGVPWTKDCHIGWWDDFIGPGKALDTDELFVICANYLGSCYGSTGPRSLDPRTGKRYGGDFPAIAVQDIVDSQRRLLRRLGITTLRAVIGSSLGGFMCLDFATRFPDEVEIVIPIATGLSVTTLQALHNFEQIVAIESDPKFLAGFYRDEDPPRHGLTLARMIGHKTFVSLDTMQHRARSKVTNQHSAMMRYKLSHPIESYMLHQGSKFTERFDANSYLRIVGAWQSFSLLSCGESYLERFARCRRQEYLIFSIDSDVCYYPNEQAELEQTLRLAGVRCKRITVHSDKGHDAFLLEPELFAPQLRAVLL